jgi:hypothetical protein
MRTASHQELITDVVALLRQVETRVRAHRAGSEDTAEATLEIADHMEQVADAYLDTAVNLRTLVIELDDDDEQADSRPGHQ